LALLFIDYIILNPYCGTLPESCSPNLDFNPLFYCLIGTLFCMSNIPIARAGEFSSEKFSPENLPKLYLPPDSL
jgi:hypothetical protein